MTLPTTPHPGSSPAQVGGREQVQLACFRIGGELYALDILRIREVIRPQKLTSVPKAPAFIEGVINLRGAVIPIVDLRKRFDCPASAIDRKTRVIISVLAGKIIGLMVDEVAEVRRFGRQDIQPAPQFLHGKGAEFFLGVCRRGEDLVMVLDLERILSNDEIIHLAEAELVRPPEKNLR